VLLQLLCKRFGPVLLSDWTCSRVDTAAGFDRLYEGLLAYLVDRDSFQGMLFDVVHAG